MNADDRPSLEITDRQGKRIEPSTARDVAEAIATLNGQLLALNRGTSLNLD